MEWVVFANFNSNSLPNKFSSPVEIVSNNVDVLVLEETKIDESFLHIQFLYQAIRGLMVWTETVTVEAS